MVGNDRSKIGIIKTFVGDDERKVFFLVLKEQFCLNEKTAVEDVSLDCKVTL